MAVPGFVDLQVNGFAGVDFATAELDGYQTAGDALVRTGVTAFRPTFITAPEEALLAAVERVPAEAIGPRLLGAHLEGPFSRRTGWERTRRSTGATRTSLSSAASSTLAPWSTSPLPRSFQVRSSSWTSSSLAA